jgi:RHS repeat-associated protein
MSRPRCVRRSTFALGAMFVILALGPDVAKGQPYLPAPGGAPGADTGDGPALFTGLAAATRADLFSGAATTRIPIDVPPGRLGATPGLALQYSSHGSASPFGYGWSVPLPRVSRSTRLGVPRFDPSDDLTLLLDEASIDLEAVPGSPRFRAKKEGAYLRIGFDRTANHWRAIDKAGTTYVFGADPTARLGPNPTHADTTAAWLLTRSIDPFGNHVDYEYVASNESEPASGLPLRIRYGGNLHTGIPHVFEVAFRWAKRAYPSTPVTSHRLGFETRSSTLLFAIETFTPAGMARRYSLNHDVDGSTGDATLVGVSLDGFAIDTGDDVALPSTVFVYSPAAAHDWPVGTKTQRRAKATIFPAPGGFRDSGSDIDFDTFDIDGDAIVDYVDARTNPPTVRRGSMTGFAPPQPWTWPATARRIRRIDNGNDIVINVFDIDGDGLPDLVDARANQCGANVWCVYRNTGLGFETTATRWPARGNRIRGVDVDGTKVRSDVVDMNGDGLPDIVDATRYTSAYPYWDVYLNTRSGFESTPVRFAALAGAISRSELDGTRSFLLYGLYDMNGDGLADFVRADVAGAGRPLPHSRAFWEVHLNTGSTFEAQPLRWRVEGPLGIRLSNFVSSNLADPDTRRTETYDELVDMNGDGRPDWVRHYNGGDYVAFGLEPLPCDTQACDLGGTVTPPGCCFHTLVFLNTGSSFSAPTPWAAWHDYLLRAYSRSPSPTKREFDLFDFDGDGLVDLVEIEDGEWRVFRHPASPHAAGSHVPESLRQRPHLLIAMMNGIGGQTWLRYRPVSTQLGNRLAFPLWTVTRQDTFDGASASPSTTSRWAYRGALYDAATAEFRGVRLAWQQDSIGRVVATEFHQDEHRAGLVERSSTLGAPSCNAVDPLDPQDPCSPWRTPLEVRENAWPATPPLLLAAHSVTPFHREQPIPELAKRIDYGYDAFGNVERETVSSPSAGTVVTETRYARHVVDGSSGLPATYMVDRPTTTYTYDVSTPDHRLAETRFGYDADPPRTGALARTARCIEWATTTCTRWQQLDYRHDRTGNVTMVRGPTGGTTTIQYDSLQIYANRATNALGAATTTQRDLSSGRQTKTVLPDGRTLSTAYDGIGRPVRHFRSGSQSGGPVIVARYFAGQPGVSLPRIRTDVLGSGPVVVFHDGLGRTRARKAWVDTAEGVRAVVSGLRRYGPDGEVIAEAAPFATPSTALDVLGVTEADARAWTTYVRDVQGRLIETTLPDGTRMLHDRSIPGVHVTVDPNLADGRFPGSATIDIRDGFGRVWRKDVCSVIPSPSVANSCPIPALLARTEYEHDGLDRTTRITVGPHTGRPATTVNTFDGLGNRTVVSSSNLGTWLYGYDDAGALASATDPRGIRTSSYYDKLGRLHRQISPDFRSSYKYHRRGYGTGLLRRVSSKTAKARISKTFTYDERARVASDEWRVRVSGPMKRRITRYAYDDSDRRVATTYPAGTTGEVDTLHTHYTPFGLPFALTLETSSGTREIVRATSYDEFGKITRIDYGNDLSDRWTYANTDSVPRLRCTRTTHFAATGDACAVHTADIRRYRVSNRDAAGNSVTVIDAKYAGSSRDKSVAYTYDALGRLTQATHSIGFTESFAYDASGNLAFDTASGAFTYSASAPNVAVSAGRWPLVHDAAGNRTAKGPWGYQYDALGRLTEARLDGSWVSRHHYDEGSQRVASENAADGSVIYYFGGLFEIEGSRITRRFHLANRLIALDVVDTTGRRTPDATASRAPPETEGLLYAHQDELGSPEMLTDQDGALVETRRYASFGTLLASYDQGGSPSPTMADGVGFNGHYRDDASRLIYFGSRHYDPTLGLFLTPDPRAEHASPYLFGGGNPVYASDPDGESLLGFLVALLEPMLASAVVSSVVSGVAAAASGGDIAGAFLDGFVAGGAGAAIGTALGGGNVAFQYGVGGSQYIELGEAMAATVEVARRAAFTTVVSHAAATATRTAGAGSDWASVAALGATLIGSYAYDGYVIKDSGADGLAGRSQRELAREGTRHANTRMGHANVTEEAAAGTGWGHQATKLTRVNLARDGRGSFLSRLRAMLNNQDHFGRLPASLGRIEGEIDAVIEGSSSEMLGITRALAANSVDAYAHGIGAATHYVQDHLTLGHMVPGTSLFAGPLGAPIRFVIHQVFGGEVAFRHAQVRATRAMLTTYGPAL